MLTDQPGKIAEGLYLLGSKQNLMYLVRGRENMIIGGGMSWIVPYLEEQLASLNIGPDDIKYLVIQHAHFDHIGAIPYMQRKFPSMKVLATAAAKLTLSREKIMQYMDVANRMAVEHSGAKERYEKFDLSIGIINVDEVIGDSTVIDLGNGKVINFIETPGHSPCALSVYIPSLKAIFPTDSALCPIGSIDNLARPSPQYDYDLYKKSMQKLLNYDIEICAFDHYAAVLGADARQVLLNAVSLCREFEGHVMDMYRETGDMEQVARQVARETIGFTRFDFVDEEIMMPVSRAVARNILKAAGVTWK
jgi:glyoxylase-like metal-dependent hydrolase (beta-lactamase superfamily II)